METLEIQTIKTKRMRPQKFHNSKSNRMFQEIPNPSTTNANWANIEKFLIQLTLSTSIKIYKFSAFIKCVPFELADKSEDRSLRVQIFPQKWKCALWHIVTWLIIFMSAFKCLHFLAVVGKQEFGTEMAVYIFNILMASLFIVFNMSLYMKPKECALMLNQHDFIFNASPELGMGNKHWASHPIVMVAVVYLSRMQTLLGISYGTIVMWKPNYSAHLYSMFPESWKGNHLLLIMCTALELCWVTWGLTTILIVFCYWAAIMFTVNTALDTLRRRLKLTMRDIQAYLYLQIFMVLFNDFNASFFTPAFYTTITAAPTLFIFLTLTTFNAVNIFVYLSFPVSGLFCTFLIIYFLPQHSKINILSTWLLKHLEKRRIETMNSRYRGSSKVPMLSTSTMLKSRSPLERQLYLEKRVHAFRPMGVRNAFFVYCSLQTSDTMMEQLCSSLILLLSLL